MKFKRSSKHATLRAAHRPANADVGWHEGMFTSIQIQRRHGRHAGNLYIPSGWDLIDLKSQQVIAEFNDETAPPSVEFKAGQHGSVLPLDGNELGEMFKEIYHICYQTTIEAMRLMARAMPEHKDSNDGEPIAQFVIGAYNRLPKTVNMTKKEALNGQAPF